MKFSWRTQTVARMRELGVTQAELAARLHYSRPYLSAILNGRAASAYVLRQIDGELSRLEQEQTDMLKTEE